MPDAGTLESRALAHLMRYCEDYVITCAIEVWRGNENARVDYKRGEISGVTVGGIDAPERLAEVMQWSSGNYRLIVQPLEAAGRGAEAAAGRRRRAREGAGARAVRAGGAPLERDQDHLRDAGRGDHQGARRRRGREGCRGRCGRRRSGSRRRRRPARPPRPRAAAAPGVTALRHPRLRHRRPRPPPTPTPAPAKVTPPGVAPSPVPAPVARASASSATKTIFGVPAPGSPGGYTPVTQPSPARVGARRRDRRRRSLKTGARKVAVPAPEVSTTPAAAADDPAATRGGYGASPAAEAPKRPSDARAR